MQCNCRNAFKCVRFRECERAAQARKIMFANRAEALFCSEETAFYQVSRDHDPQRVIKDFRKLAPSGLYTIETTENNGLHINFIASAAADLGALSNFSSAIETREEARNIGAYMSKPEQAPTLAALSDATGLRQVSNSWGGFRRLESFLKSERMARKAPHVFGASMSVIISNSLNLDRKALERVEKNPMLQTLKSVLIDAYQQLIETEQKEVYIPKFDEFLTVEKVEKMLTKIAGVKGR